MSKGVVVTVWRAIGETTTAADPSGSDPSPYRNPGVYLYLAGARLSLPDLTIPLDDGQRVWHVVERIEHLGDSWRMNSTRPATDTPPRATSVAAFLGR